MENNQQKKLNLIIIAVLSVFVIIILSLGFLAYSFRIDARKFVDNLIYSNQFHYLECEKMPSYELSKINFDEQKPKILELINKLELEYLKSAPDGRVIASTVLEDEVRGNFISFTLSQICNDRAELNITFTSNDYLPEIKNFLDNNLNNIPYNLIND